MRLRLDLFGLVIMWAAASAQAADYRLEVLTEAAPADAVPAAVLEKLSPQGISVIRGKSKVLCEIWMCQSWTSVADFKPSPKILYPFRPGDVLGVVRYRSKGKDFRGQSIPSGVYLIRYGVQPEDGNHVGTSATRDFLVLTPAADDQSADPLDEKSLFKLSAKVAGGKHPAMLCLIQPTAVHEKPEMRNSEDWWILQLPGKKSLDGQDSDQPLEMVVVGESKG